MRKLPITMNVLEHVLWRQIVLLAANNRACCRRPHSCAGPTGRSASGQRQCDVQLLLGVEHV
jgi:hypothetical protein